MDHLILDFQFEVAYSILVFQQHWKSGASKLNVSHLAHCNAGCTYCSLYLYITAGSDYVCVTRNPYIFNKANSVHTATCTIVNDQVSELTETFLVFLSANTTANVTISPEMAVVTILDDDGKRSWQCADIQLMYDHSDIVQ